MTELPAILICGHGTTDPDALAGFEAMVSNIQLRHPGRRIAHGYLELSSPSYAEALEALHAEGFREVTALPVLLFTAGHALHDLPEALKRAAEALPGLELTLGQPLGLSPAVVASASLVAATALPEGQDPKDTLLLVVGRGTSVPMANAEVAKLTRLVGERLGLGFSTTAFIAVTDPSPEAALALLENLPLKHGILMPVVLFDGMLYKQLARTLSEHRLVSAKTWTLTQPLCSVRAWQETFTERLLEVERQCV